MAFDPFWLTAADHLKQLLVFMPGFDLSDFEAFRKCPVVGYQSLPPDELDLLKKRHYIFMKNGPEVFATTLHVMRHA